jgi:hypothetical protein
MTDRISRPPPVESIAALGKSLHDLGIPDAVIVVPKRREEEFFGRFGVKVRNLAHFADRADGLVEIKIYGVTFALGSQAPWRDDEESA